MTPAAHALAPTGATHEVGVDELFFSTTDARGVIERANRVFVDLSRFSAEELRGAPHNIIRHPAMPGGAFQALWSTVESGRPFAAYVRNLAADGSEYDVLATITPLPAGGYLSVRTRPVVAELFEAATGIYAVVRAEEDSARAAGSTRHEAAVTGAGRMLAQLDELGFVSYEAFQNTVLPEEVARREELSAGLPERPEATGELAEMLVTARTLFADLDSSMRRLDELAALGTDLRRAGKRLSRVVSAPEITAEAVAALDRSDSRLTTLGQLLDLWVQMQAIVIPQVENLLAALSAMDETVSRTRFRIALARLHTTVTATFVAETIDAAAQPGTPSALSDGAVGALLDALEDGLTDLDAQAREHSELAEETIHAIEQASRVMDIPRQLLMLWTADPHSQDQDLPEAASALSQAAQSAVARTDAQLEELAGLARRCRELAQGSSVEPARREVAALRRSLGALSSAD